MVLRSEFNDESLQFGSPAWTASRRYDLLGMFSAGLIFLRRVNVRGGNGLDTILRPAEARGSLIVQMLKVHRPKALIAWSSGKDSAWALHICRDAGEFEIVGALTTITEDFKRVSMHGVREELVAAQLEAAGLRPTTVHIPFPCPNEIYERKMASAMAAAKSAGVTHIVFGDLFLEDVRAYRERQLAGSGISPVFPLWGKPTRQLAHEMIAMGMEAHLCTVDLKKLPASFAGRRFERSLLDVLPAGVDPCGENGEFHTFVSNGPMLSSRIAVRAGETVEREGFVFADLLPA